MPSPVSNRPIRILLIEDNPVDAKLIRKAFEKASIPSEIESVDNGVIALRLLRQEGEYAEKTRPDIVLLDLNLPLKDGREVLTEIKLDDSLKRIPVVVLSSSDDERDIMKSYQHQANCFITKPVSMDDLVRVVQTIDGFWRTTVKLPPA